MFYNTIFSLAMAASAFSSPVITKRAGFDCNSAYNTCIAKPNARITECTQNLEACRSCAQSEDICREGADYGKGLACTVKAQVCYFNAENPTTTYGVYDCAQALITCDKAHNTNHAFCASQNDGCKSCQTQQYQCNSADGANHASCSSQANKCFTYAMIFDGSALGYHQQSSTA